jgi:membrane-bound lytic murein transglycosylase A
MRAGQARAIPPRTQSAPRPRPRAAVVPFASLALLACLALAACGPRAPKPVALDRLPGFAEDRVEDAKATVLASCARFDRGDAAAAVGPNAIAGTIAAWRVACADLRADPDFRAALLRNFEALPMRGEDGAEQGLFTGYYEPAIAASPERSERATVPIYGKPADLVTVDLGQFRDALKGQRISGRVQDGKLVPYDDRAQIARGGLDGRAPVLAWAEDPVALFVLEIQGSGRLLYPDGNVQRLGYAAGNGRSYVPIGRTLVAEGALSQEQVSMPAIRAWLAANPDRVRAVLDSNPSQVFFRLTSTPATGSAGIPLTPGRSLAIDTKYLPLDAPLWLDCEDPRANEKGGRLRRLVVAQDTGGAIQGAVRGDLFWGPGAEAEDAAGRMKSRGALWLLRPKNVTK